LAQFNGVSVLPSANPYARNVCPDFCQISSFPNIRMSPFFLHSFLILIGNHFFFPRRKSVPACLFFQTTRTKPLRSSDFLASSSLPQSHGYRYNLDCPSVPLFRLYPHVASWIQSPFFPPFNLLSHVYLSLRDVSSPPPLLPPAAAIILG